MNLIPAIFFMTLPILALSQPATQLAASSYCMYRCDTCTDYYTCTSCTPGYYLNYPSCYDCPANCAACHSGSSCYRCISGYMMIGNSCWNTALMVISKILLALLLCIVLLWACKSAKKRRAEQAANNARNQALYHQPAAYPQQQAPGPQQSTNPFAE